jgi:uridine phosphorylase
MQALKAHVRSGRIVVDEPTNLPEGTELYLVPGDDRDDLDTEERAALHEAIEESERELDAGNVVSEDEIRSMLRAIR